MFAAILMPNVDKKMWKPPKLAHLQGQKQFRIIPSVYPPINFFEDLVDPSEMETLWEIESLTNERIRQEVGDIFLVPAHDRISGPGSSIVMAAFTHIGKASRFTDGSFGVYYASLSLETAIRETVYHRELFLKATQQESCELTMRLYEGKIIKPLHDLKEPKFKLYHEPQDYTESQRFGKTLRSEKSWGVLYKSVRHKTGDCIAVFRPPAISIPKPVSHLRYLWNGEKITEVYDAKSLIQF
jgi:hypothetical protein